MVFLQTGKSLRKVPSASVARRIETDLRCSRAVFLFAYATKTGGGLREFGEPVSRGWLLRYLAQFTDLGFAVGIHDYLLPFVCRRIPETDVASR